jgi:mevalonate kinase
LALQFKVPGKTFLAGEYLVLHGGPALILLTEPSFELAISQGSGELVGVHSNSPAGKFFEHHRKDFDGYQMTFNDPYQGKGGFGASTAQFLSLYGFRLLLKEFCQDLGKSIDSSDLLETYFKYAWNGQGMRPSGADLIGQFKGLLTLFDKQSENVSLKFWPFEDLDFFVVHTGNKVATHEHLREVSEFDSSKLHLIFRMIQRGLDETDSELFVEGVNQYAKELERLGLTCEETLEMLKSIRGLEGIVAVKGCGALGADVLLALCKKASAVDFINYCMQKSILVVASSKNISQGLRMEGSL